MWGHEFGRLVLYPFNWLLNSGSQARISCSVSTEESTKLIGSVGIDAVIDSSMPLVLPFSSQSPRLASTAEVPALENVPNAEPGMKHVALGEADQDDGEPLFMSTYFSASCAFEQRQYPRLHTPLVLSRGMLRPL